MYIVYTTFNIIRLCLPLYIFISFKVHMDLTQRAVGDTHTNA